jgi:acyl-coenzyme A thioesterase PaaI-like protein
MATTEALRHAIEGDGAERVLTLDPAFQGLPDTAHGGSLLAVFDAVAGRGGARVIEGQYHRRVPLGVPLALRIGEDGEARAFELAEAGAVLARGRVSPGGGTGGPSPALPAPAAPALPVSRTCFACGTDNPLGLRLRLRADDAAVGGTWTPRPGFTAFDGTLAPVALTTLLDEVAFWLGALATGESGMTTTLHVTLHRPVAAGTRLLVAGSRAEVRPRPGDPRYLHTSVVALDEAGRPVASAAITFVAVRGAARRLVAGLLAVNPPELLRRVFPGYARA